MKKIEEIIKNEPKYREGQIKKALFFNLIEDWNEATILPQILREELNKKFNLAINVKVFESENGNTIKALITLGDGIKIETVLMKHKENRNTVCVSSQIGCPLCCVFCATGKLGFKRNLTDWEIILQILFFTRLLKKTNRKITNVVFMGMGEPFLNYDNVLSAIKILNDKNGFNLGARHISISTAGIAEGIKKLSDEKLQVNLAISLHAPTDELRSKIMPINKKYNINSVLEAVDEYIEKTKRRVMIEYVMIKGVNDSEECARLLSKIMKRPLCFVNLISYNVAIDNLVEEDKIFEPSSVLTIKKFKEILEKNKVAVTQRYRFGENIEAACGQLVAIS